MPITLTKYQRTSYKWLGRFGEKRANQHLQDALQSAHMEIRAGAYLSYVLLSTIIGFLCSLIVMVSLVFLVFPLFGVGLDTGLVVFFFLIPGFISARNYLWDVTILAKKPSEGT